MSLKRDGNDTELLKNLQHRRVAEILGDHIPDDEAKLLSNGRLTCTVCSSRPIFDTMQMLSLHRKGKKHLYELSCYLEYKRDLEYKKAKQTQKSFLKNEQFTIKTSMRTHNKRKSYKNLLNRKVILDITDSCDKLKSSLSPPIVVSSSANSQVRRYLKSLCKKKPLGKNLNKLQESYGGSSQQSKTKVDVKLECKKLEKITSESKNVEYEIKLLESGWIQDKSGKWVKDPNVEFDSDEEEPPGFF